MKLSEVFDHLISGELANTNIGLNLEEGVSPLNYRMLVNYINLALLQLYTRFPLRTEQAYIQMHEDIQLYHLRKEYCVTNAASTQPNKYIIDTVDNPLSERILKIDAVYLEDGTEIPLEDESADTSVFLPETDTIQVLDPNEFVALFVMYRAAPNRLSTDVHHLDCEQEFNLPYTLLEPLLTYVTAKVYGSFHTPEMNNKYTMCMSRYNQMILEHIHNGLVTDTSKNSKSLREKGWV